MEILEFIFSSFWIWVGTLILITAPIAAFAKVVYAFRCKGDPDDI